MSAIKIEGPGVDFYTDFDFDKIHNQCRGKPRQNPDKHYQMVRTSNLKKVSQKKKKKALGAYLRFECKDLYIEKGSFF